MMGVAHRLNRMGEQALPATAVRVLSAMSHGATSIDDLMKATGLARGTVAVATRLLVEAGLASRQAGMQGTLRPRYRVVR